MADGSQQQNDHSLSPFWICAGILLMLGIVWYVAHAYIVAFVLKIKYGEAWLVHALTGKLNDDQIGGLIWLQHTDPATVTFGQLMEAVTRVGWYVMIPFAVITAFFCFWLVFRNSSDKFRKTQSMDNLAQLEKENWPQIMPVVGLGLVDEDINKGPWAMCQSPMMFAKAHKLLRKDPLAASKKKSRHVKQVAALSRGKAHRVFTLQLGPYWRGVDALPMHAKAIFAACAARGNHDVKAASEMLEKINRSIKTGKLDFSSVDEVLNKYKDSKVVREICSRHAYLLTIMPSMLILARGEGVFATADFLWLKPVDRKLWFVLNNVGRQTAFSEIAGVMAHWYAENEMQRPLYVPMVEEAVNALEDMVREFVYNPEEDEEDDASSTSQVA